MKENTILNRVRTLLGMDIKLETMLLSDGATTIEAEMFEAGQEVFVVTADEQRIPVPVGEYEMEDMRILVVTEEGIIAEIKEAVSEEAPEVEVEVEAPEEVLSQEPTVPKKTIETSSTVKESHFTSEQVEELKQEIDELKTQLASQVEVAEEVAPIELSEEPKPIAYNPENKTEVNVFKIASQAKRTTMHSIMDKISNI